MAYIKEPEGVDFVIQSEPLTDKARQEISNFIKEYKAQPSHRKALKNAINSRKKQTSKV